MSSPFDRKKLFLRRVGAMSIGRNEVFIHLEEFQEYSRAQPPSSEVEVFSYHRTARFLWKQLRKKKITVKSYINMMPLILSAVLKLSGHPFFWILTLRDEIAQQRYKQSCLDRKLLCCHCGIVASRWVHCVVVKICSVIYVCWANGIQPVIISFRCPFTELVVSVMGFLHQP